jgi:hypothetical protein
LASVDALWSQDKSERKEEVSKDLEEVGGSESDESDADESDSQDSDGDGDSGDSETANGSVSDSEVSEHPLPTNICSSEDKSLCNLLCFKSDLI